MSEQELRLKAEDDRQFGADVDRELAVHAAAPFDGEPLSDHERAAIDEWDRRKSDGA